MTCLNCGAKIAKGSFCAVCRPLVRAYGRTLVSDPKVLDRLVRRDVRGKRGQA